MAFTNNENTAWFPDRSGEPREISGWGRVPVVRAFADYPASLAEARAVGTIAGTLDGTTDATTGLFPASHSLPRALPSALPRGLGRSYGDASLPLPGNHFADSRFLDRFIAFDPATGILEAEEGVSLRAILEALVPRGWFLPVTPGTQWVTLGGAVAANVHGKNHHHCGSLEHFVEALEVATPSGVFTCGRAERPDLFRATVGGYGLTGFITRVALRMKRISSPRIRTRALRGASLSALFEGFRAHDAAHEYSVAWVDTLAGGKSLGRGVLLLGNHEEGAAVDARAGDDAHVRRGAFKPPRALFSVPFSAPSGILQPWALRLFNGAYYHAPRGGGEKTAHYGGYFYPLDILGDWNKMYGPRGFFQYQCVIPDEDGKGAGEPGLEACLRYLARHGMGSFLAVLKRCGDDTVALPFCKRGYSLALDVPNRGAETLRRLDALDGIVREHGGRVYLAKDARLPRETFRAMYPGWKTWMDAVRRYNPEGAGRSLLSERLGLWET